MQEGSRAEKPKIGPKPVIATKPKHIPPVRTQRLIRDDNARRTSEPRAIHAKPVPKEGRPADYREVYVSQKETATTKTHTISETYLGNKQIETNIKYDEYTSSFISEKCDKFSTSYDMYKKVEEKAPSSPSTVCCSILSNATTDCCGIINVNKNKELCGKMTKIDSLDSNSSDSGGFKDFVQLDLTKNLSLDTHEKTHQRQVSQPDLRPVEPKPATYTHQRNASQTNQDFRQSKQTFNTVANAQALVQFLPQTERRMLEHKQDVVDGAAFRQHIAKFNKSSAGAEDVKAKPKPVIAHGQFQQSTKKLEELFSQRLEKDKVALRKGGVVDGQSSQDVEQKMMVQKQIHQKLQADLQQTVKQIQEYQSIELRLPQNRKWNEVRVFISRCVFCSSFTLIIYANSRNECRA